MHLEAQCISADVHPTGHGVKETCPHPGGHVSGLGARGPVMAPTSLWVRGSAVVMEPGEGGYTQNHTSRERHHYRKTPLTPSKVATDPHGVKITIQRQVPTGRHQEKWGH